MAWLGLGLLLGTSTGGAIAWFWGQVKGREAFEPLLRQREADARAASALAEELRSREAGLVGRLSAAEADRLAAHSALAAADARVDELGRSLAEQKGLLEVADERLGHTFRALAAEALQQNNEGFLTLAERRLEETRQAAAHELSSKHQAFDAALSPMQQALARVDQQMATLEKERAVAHATILAQVRALDEGQRMLRSETGNLVRALRAPSVRGRWGEMQLRRVVELAGMTDHCDFMEQKTLGEVGQARLRPDLVVNLAGGQALVVDAKAPLEAYLRSLEATCDEERRCALVDHAQQVRAHVGKLASKAYWSELPSSPELVVLFLPGEAFYAAALEHAPTLLEEAAAQRVLLASPTNLISLLQMAFHGWRQARLAESAEEIARIGRELHERIATFGEHFTKLGRSLEKSVTDFNGTVASLEGRVLPAARRFEDLGAKSKKDLPLLRQIEVRARVAAATETKTVVVAPLLPLTGTAE